MWCASQDGQHGIVAALPCVSWERRRVWVIEGRPASSSSYAYSKCILYIDQDFFGIVLTELHDQDEKLRKAYLPCLFYTALLFPEQSTSIQKSGLFFPIPSWLICSGCMRLSPSHRQVRNLPQRGEMKSISTKLFPTTYSRHMLRQLCGKEDKLLDINSVRSSSPHRFQVGPVHVPRSDSLFLERAVTIGAGIQCELDRRIAQWILPSQ